MKRLLFLLTMFLLTVGINAQIKIAEADFTTATEFTGWTQFDDSQTDGKVELRAGEGLAITVGVQTGQYWQPQIMVIPDGSFNLEKDCDYKVVITAKFPTAGTLQINMGSWSANNQGKISVKASDDFQTIECDFKGWSVTAEGAHLLFQCGGFKGTTIVKKIEVFRVIKFGADLHLSTPNSLSGEMPPGSMKFQVEVMTLTGYLNSADIAFIRRSAGAPVNYDRERGGAYMEEESGNIFGKLCVLDISGATIVSGGEYYYKLWVDIGNDGFYVCRDEVSTSNNVISEYMFMDCKLAKISLPNNVTKIEYSAFRNCKNLTEIVIPQSVTSIGDYAFYGCSGLTSVTIPNSVTSIGSSAFSGCSRLKTVISDIENPFEINSNNFPNEVLSSAKLIVPAGKKSAYQSTEGWKQFQNIIEVGGVGYEFEVDGIRYTIGENYTASVTSGKNKNSGDVIIPQKVTFNGVLYTVTEIGLFAFSGCSGLISITIPNSVTSIGSNAFSGCSSLNAVRISDLAAWCNIDFCDEGKYDYLSNPLVYANHLYLNGSKVMSLVIPDGVKEIKTGAFYGGSDITSVTIPNSVTSIGDNSFGCCNLSSLTIPNSVTYLGWGSFKYNRDMKSVAIPNSVTYIGGWAFWKCNALASVTIPNSVTEIFESTFKDCSGLTSVTIPNSVTSIGSSAFSGCSSLKTVISEIETPFDINSNSVFPNEVLSSAKLIVPGGKKSAYQSTEGWKQFQKIIEVGGVGYEFVADGIRYIIGENNTVFVTSGKTKYSGEVIIPEKVTFNDTSYTVTEIGESAFSDCSGLTSVTIGNSVISIGRSAFSGCSGLTSITIPNSVTSIDMHAFSYCSSLTSVTIPNNVTILTNYVFKGCIGLTSVTIGNGVGIIADGAFEYCDNLESVIIGTNVTFIAGYTFTQKSLKYICFTSEKLPTYFDVNTTCQYIMPQMAFDGGIPQRLTNYVTYSVAPKYIKVKSTTATTATLELTPIDISGGNSESATSYEVTMYNLKPGSSVVGSWEWDGKDCGIASIPTAMTKNLVMNVQAAQAMSTTKARLSATVNEADDDKHYGFEWLRYDAPSNMTPYKVSAPLYNGEIVGTLSGLNPDIYYKYRPFYKADDGTVFVGEWEAFLTGDANVTFAPEVHTKEPVALSDGKMILLLFCAEGTEAILEKGFELIKKAIESFGTRADSEDITKVIVNGNEMSATIEGLEPGTEYICRSYVKTASGTTYGEEKTFKTPLPGDANNDGIVNVADIVEITNAKAGNPSASFNLTNADMEGNGSVTEVDINAIANKIMQK